MQKNLRTEARNFICIVLALLCAVAQANAQPMPETDTNARILQFADAIENEQDIDRRANRSTDLFLYVSPDFVSEYGQADLAEIDPATIDAVAELLTNDVPSVRSDIARTLGSMGPVAVRAVPALQAALHRELTKREQEEPSIHLIIRGPNAVGFICEAFELIGENPEPGICINGDFNPRWRSAPQ